MVFVLKHLPGLTFANWMVQFPPPLLPTMPTSCVLICLEQEPSARFKAYENQTHLCYCWVARDDDIQGPETWSFKFRQIEGREAYPTVLCICERKHQQINGCLPSSLYHRHHHHHRNWRQVKQQKVGMMLKAAGSTAKRTKGQLLEDMLETACVGYDTEACDWWPIGVD